MDDHHRLPLPFQLAQHLYDRLFRGGIHAGKGFIHQVDPGVLRQGAGQKNPLLLAARKLADLAVGVVGHAHLLQTGEGEFLIRFPGPLQPSQPTVPPHQHHIQRIGRKIPVDGFPLRDVTDDGPLFFIRLSVNANLSGSQGQKAQNRLDQRRFSGAVRTDDPDQFPLRRFKGNIPEHRLAVVSDGQVSHRYGNRPLLHVSPSSSISSFQR